MGKSDIDKILSEYDNVKFYFSARYLWLFSGLIVTVLTAIIVTVLLNKYEPTIKISQIIPIITPIIAGGAVITTLIYHTFNYHLNQELNTLKIRQDRRNLAISIIGEFQKKEMMEAAIFTIVYFKKNSHTNIKDLSAAIQADETLRLCATILLNFYERVSLAADLGVADEQMLRDFFRGIFKRQYFILREYIADIRRDRQDDQIFLRFEKAALRWNND